MGLPVCQVLGGQILAADYQQVLGVGCLRVLGEIERPCNDGPAVEDMVLICGAIVLSVDEDRDSGASPGSRLRCTARLSALIEDGLNVDATMMGVEQDRGDRLGCETVRLNEDTLAGRFDLPNDGIRTPSAGREKTSIFAVGTANSGRAGRQPAGTREGQAHDRPCLFT